MMDRALTCEKCGRLIPVLPLWTALAKRARLTCTACKHQVTHEHLTLRAENDDFAKALLLAYGQLVAYGWTSYGTLVNAGVQGNPHAIGGLFSGLVRAGLVQRASPESRLDKFVDPHPVFVPGPRFPQKTAQVG